MNLPTRTAVLAIVTWLAAVPAAAAAPPNASFSVSPASPHTLETVTFTSTSTGDITSQSWDLDNQGGCNDGAGPSAQRSFPVAGTYRITLCVVGPEGEAAQAQQVVITNQAPMASLIQVPAKPTTGETVTFVSTSKDPDGAIVSEGWDLNGDGAFDDGLGVSTSRAFLLPGTYAVGLLVTDSNGSQAVANQTVSVRAGLLDPFPTVAIQGVVADGGIEIRTFTVDAPRDATVRIRCRGPGCPKRRSRASKARRFARFERRLGAGAVIKVFVTKLGTVGKYTSFRIRRSRTPDRRDLCLFPGRKRPRKCPST